MEDLDRHVPIQSLVVGPIHHAHPALADLVDDAVVAEGATDEVSHYLDSYGAMVSQPRGRDEMRANRRLSPGAPGVHHEERRSVGVLLLRERLEERTGGTLPLARQCNDAKRGTVDTIAVTYRYPEPLSRKSAYSLENHLILTGEKEGQPVVGDRE